MWQKYIKTFFASLLFFQLTLSSAYAAEPTQALQEENQGEYINFQMLSINDFHGNLDTKSKLEGKEVGGAAYLATHLNAQQKVMEEQSKKEGRKSYTLRLHAGDTVGASPSLSSLLQDEPTMETINKMGFKLGVLGNHSFDEGIPEFKRLLYATSVHPNVAKYTEGLNYEYHGIDDDFNYLAANVVDKASGKPIFDPYIIKNIQGVNVGFIGIVTTETPTSAMPKYTDPYQFLDEAKTINKYTEKLKEQGVKAIVVIAHEGAATNGSVTTGVMADVATKIDDEVDIIFAAHSHEYANGVVDGKLIVQNYNYGQAFGDVRTQLDPMTDDFVKGSIKAEMILNTPNVTPDPEIQAIVDEAKKVTEKASEQIIGLAASGDPIGKRKPEDGENELGNLVTDAQSFMIPDADFAITNSGGIREALLPETNEKDEHNLTWKAAYAVQPFNNYIQLIELTGQQIKDGLNQQWQNPDELMFLQFSGFNYTYVDGNKTSDCKQVYCVKDVFLEDGKTKMNMSKTYKVAMNEFLAGGGDGFTAFANNKVLKNDSTDTDIFVAYIEKLAEEGKKVDPKMEGRAALVEPANSKDSIVNLRVMETTDIHSHVVDYNYYQDIPTDESGLALTATLIKQARSQVKNSILFDNGDLIQGNPLGDYLAEKGLKEGDVHAVYKAMNLLDYAGGNIGNHEFNYGIDYLKEAIDDANFPYINANVYVDDGDNNPDNDKNLFTPYKIIHKQAVDENGKEQTVDIGVIGFVPPQIMTWDKANLQGKVIAKDIYITAQKFVPKMIEEGADIIVAIPHSGVGTEEITEEEEDAVYNLTKVEGIDAILFGHSHLIFPSDDFAEIPNVDLEKGTINGMPSVEAGKWGDHLGIIDLTLQKNGDDWDVVDSSSEARPIYDAKTGKALVEADQEVLDAVKKDHQATLDYIRSIVGETSVPIYSYFAQVKDDPSVQIVSDAQTWYTEKAVKGTEYEGLPILSAAAPFKVGGRNGASYYTDISAGPLTIINVSDLYVYPNTLMVVKLKGKQVREWLEKSAGQFHQIDPNKTEAQPIVNEDYRAYNFDVIDGVSYQIDVTQPSRYNGAEIINPDSHRIVNLEYNGKPIEEEQEFLIATNNYRAGGGGHFPNLDGNQIVLAPQAETRQVIIDYIKEKGTIDPSADQNWSFVPIEVDVNLTFLSSPKAQKFIDPKGYISYIGDATEGFAKYQIELNRLTNNHDDKADEEDSEGDNVKPGADNESLDADDVKQETNHASPKVDDPKVGHKLPNTSTNMFNFLLVSTILVAVGLIILAYRKKRV